MIEWEQSSRSCSDRLTEPAQGKGGPRQKHASSSGVYLIILNEAAL